MRHGPQSHAETSPRRAGEQPQQCLGSELDGILGLVAEDCGPPLPEPGSSPTLSHLVGK